LVPLQLKAGGKVQQYVLTNKSHTFAVPENTPFKLNQGQTSLYRVNYSKELIQQFINELASPNSGVLDDPSDRAGIISDLGVLSRSGEQSSVTFLTLADALKGESNYLLVPYPFFAKKK
jgi:aminopeptidase 2